MSCEHLQCALFGIISNIYSNKCEGSAWEQVVKAYFNVTQISLEVSRSINQIDIFNSHVMI